MTISTTRLTATKSLIAAGAVVAALFTIAPAEAGRMDRGLSLSNGAATVNVHYRYGHRGHGRYGIMAPHEIRYSLRNQGLRGIRDIRYRPNRNLYVAKGWMYGRFLKVRINPYSGMIVGSRVLRVGNRGYGYDHLRHWRGGHDGYGGLSIYGPNGSFRFRW